MSWSTTLKNRQRIRAALDAGETIAVMFSDIRGFTSYTAREGDDAAFRLSQLHRRLLEEIIEECGGVLVKTLGDGIMAAFPEPGRGLGAAASIQRAIRDKNRTSDDVQIDVGIGLAAGTPIMTEADLIGHSVNLSQRISSLAKGGQILLDASVFDAAAVPQDVRCIPLGPRKLKGLGEESVYELLWLPERARISDGKDLVTLILTDRNTLLIEVAKELAMPSPPEEGAFSRGLSKWIRRGTQAIVRASLGAFGVREHPLDAVHATLHGRDLVLRYGNGGLRLRDVDPELAKTFIEQMSVQ